MIDWKTEYESEHEKRLADKARIAELEAALRVGIEALRHAPLTKRCADALALMRSTLETDCEHVWVDSPDVSDEHCVRCGVAPGEEHASADHDFEAKIKGEQDVQ